MTTEEFNKKSCELIEVIQELDINLTLLRRELLALREQYIEERKGNVE